MDSRDNPPRDPNAPEEVKHEVHHEETRRKVPVEYEPEYYEPVAGETQQATNVIGWIVAIVLLALAIWLLWIALR